MHLNDAEQFFYDIIYGEVIRGRCLEIAALPAEERGAAIRALGYEFNAKELDAVVCREYFRLPEGKRRVLGPGDLRDFMMRVWGNYM